MIGRTISHYKILEKLGQGGMGVVYRAEDTRLGRPVALKFLSSDLGADDEASRRFIQEARAASALDHRNICTVYDIGNDSDGSMFIVMAYYDGETLHQRLKRGPFDTDEGLGLITQIVSGLGKAHAHGIVHRDLKPANILITADGEAKILDFGLAKLAGQTRVTKTGTTLGTLSYMAPEQCRSEPVDERSDIFSLGALMYEVFTGHVAFPGDYEAAVIYKILNEAPLPLTDHRPDLPAGLQRIVERALLKNRDARYASSEEFLADLQHLRSEMATGRPGPATIDPQPSIAVLPFVDMSPQRDQEYFCDGIAEEIISALARVKGLHVVARTSAFSFKGKIGDIREIGRQLNVGAVLEGSVKKAGDRLRITAQLISVRDGFHLWSDRYDRKMEDVFAVQDEISQSIVETLKIKLIGATAEPLVRRHTNNIEAYKLYLKGRFLWNKRNREALARGMELFEQAIQLDPGYGPAYAGLADTYNILGWYNFLPPRETFPKAKAAARKALDIDDSLAEAHAALAYATLYYDWDWAACEAACRRAIDLAPNYAIAHHFYCAYLMPMRRFEEAHVQSSLALELDPLSLIINTLPGQALYYQGRHAEAVREYERVMEMDNDFAPGHFFLGLAHVANAAFDNAVDAFQKVSDLFHGDTLSKTAIAYAHAAAGRSSDADRVLEELKAQSKNEFVPSYYIAAAQNLLGRKELAVRELEQAYENREHWLVYLNIDSVCESLRPTTEFKTILTKMGLPSGSR